MDVYLIYEKHEYVTPQLNCIVSTETLAWRRCYNIAKRYLRRMKNRNKTSTIRKIYCGYMVSTESDKKFKNYTIVDEMYVTFSNHNVEQGE